MTIVVDSSAIVALALTDEDAAYAESVLDSLGVEVDLSRLPNLGKIELTWRMNDEIAPTERELSERCQTALLTGLHPLDPGNLSQAERRAIGPRNYIGTGVEFGRLTTLTQRLHVERMCQHHRLAGVACHRIFGEAAFARR